ncbi:MAG: VWA domain-containing protein [Armatimonadota bacterium]|nr:VWA domain-containing protein [Armatimonadota bacterium]
MIQFTKPLYLLLLPPIAYYAWSLSRRSLTDMSKFRSRLALGLRLAIVIMLVFALAGARMVRNAAEQCVIFVMDVSDSIPRTNQDAALRYVNNALKTMKSSSKAGVIAFGGDASVELAPSAAAKLDKIYSVPSGSNTDISQALGLALALFPEKCAKKIVLLSDGNETWGRSIDQATLAGSENVSIDVVPVANELPHEALLDTMICPNSVKVGEPFDLKLVTVSKEPSPARVRILRNGSPMVDRVIQLAKGKSVFTFQQSIPKAGNYEFRAIMEAGADTRVENNQALGYVMVRGKPRALYVEGKRGQERYLAKALQGRDIDLEIRDRAGLPYTLPRLRGYDMVILSDTPAWDISPEQMAMIRSGVKDLGIGFTMIGGEDSFGAGGYYATPIEEALPVDMSVRKSKVMPSLSVVIVMDKSGSMGMIQDGREKIQMANDAAAAVVQLLQPIDRVGVIVCHDWPGIAVDLQPASNKGPIYNQIATIRAGGGGIMVYPSMDMAYKTIAGSPTRQKHVILLADGADCDSPEGTVALAYQMARQRVTTTAVAIGDGKDVPFLKAVAAAGRGDFYMTLRARDLKAIFTKDVMQVSKSLIVEEPFVPRMDTSCPELGGIDPASTPPLLGYVATSPKPAAAVSMVSHKKDPILATWQYGLGRSAAFTSDCKARWSARWLSWPGYAKFWAQVVRSTMRKSSARDFQTTVEVTGGVGHVVVDAVDEKGSFLNLIKFGGSVVGPDLKSRPLAIEQTGPGRYEAGFEAKEVGSYVVNVVRKGSDQGVETNVVDIPYPTEYKDITRNTPLLKRLASETSGRFDPKASDVFRTGFRRSRVFSDLWQTLLLLAALLVPMDVAVRRLVVTPEQALEIYHRVADLISERLAGRKSRRRPQPETVETVDSLLKVKKDRRASLTTFQPPKCDDVPPATKPPDKPAPAPKAPEEKVEEDTTSRLLAAKKRAREKE